MNIKKILLIGLIIVVVCGLIYVAIPKYQIQSVRVDDNTVVVTRINTITGEITTEKVFKSVFDKYGKLRFTF